MSRRRTSGTIAQKERIRRQLDRQRALRTYTVVGALVAIAVAIALVIALQPPSIGGGGSSNVGLRPGQAAPEISVTDIDGRTITLANLSGKVVLLDFMGVNCPPCRAEMPHLVATYNQLHSRGLETLSIDVGIAGLTANSDDEARAFMQSFHAGWSIARRGGTLAGVTYNVNTIPNFYIIDKQGMVRVHPTQDPLPISEDRFAAWINPLLAG